MSASRSGRGFRQVSRSSERSPTPLHCRWPAGGPLTVDERCLDAVRVPRPTAVHLAAEELEGHAVGVRVHVTADLRDVRRATKWAAADVGPHLGPLRTPRGAVQAEPLGGRGHHEVAGGIGRKAPVSYTHLRAHETDSYLVCRLLL